MILEARVKAPPNVSSTDGSTYEASLGKLQELLFSELTGKYFTLNYRGKVWAASLTSASAIPVAATNATPNFIVWNPSGNTTAVALIRLNVGFAAGTGVAGMIGYSYIPNAGSAVATAASISAFTAGPAIQSGIGGTAYGGNVKFGTAATVTGTGNGIPVRWRWSNLSQGAPITTTTSVYSLYEDFDGTMILPPNVAFYIDASAAIAETMMISLVAAEVPWP